ncbi:hypothetical protein LINPERPRIM_LOCUS30592, partial [Linum perenne]
SVSLHSLPYVCQTAVLPKEASIDEDQPQTDHPLLLPPVFLVRLPQENKELLQGIGLNSISAGIGNCDGIWAFCRKTWQYTYAIGHPQESS